MAESKPTTRRLAIRAVGVVQGVGFRPFVHNTAKALNLSGFVLNAADRVEIEIQGSEEAIEQFLTALRTAAPPQSRIDTMETTELDCHEEPAGAFEIRASHGLARRLPIVPADLATCHECLAEIHGPKERRHFYPFTNCTNCGPRWSIIEELPYDRPRTSMAGFTMCPQCRAEYDNPADRRFHAQPIACPRCGPELELLDRRGHTLAEGDHALRLTAESLAAGQIVAMKGLGGFQLLVDATNESAVVELRTRKRRPDRPFALLIASLDEIARYCHLGKEEAAALGSAAAPILLLKRRDDSAAARLAASVAPGNPDLGVMLPYTPLHHLLMDLVGRPLVCTSGNLSEEPMAITTEDAFKRLGPIADVFLVHDRPIVRPVDDSVGRVGPEGLQLFRRARGYAPMPIDLGFPAPTILALGGHLKNTVALCLGETEASSKVVLSAHIGDLGSVASEEVFHKAVSDLVQFFQVVPDVLACDLHPDYASTRLAEQLAHVWKRPLLRVQHHHAHTAACMAEHGLEGPVLALCWDGTGYGADGTVWGGEALVCHGGEFVRTAHLRTFSLPGGDRASREPRRSALGLLYEIFGDDALGFAGQWFQPDELKTLHTMLRRGTNSPRTSSMGRLFDGVSALCGLNARSTFEGQGAMALEFAASPSEATAYPLPLTEGATAVANWEPLLRAVIADIRQHEPTNRIAAKFHNSLADLALEIARKSGCQAVVLSGGCFQNALLLQKVYLRLSSSRFTVKVHRLVPPGDGGIALGQVYVAAKHHGGSR